MDSSWYKRAVDQHAIEPDSFVFSVPFDSGYTSKTNSTLVTAAHAIFVEQRGHNKAPAAVVGLQFHHDSLARHFINITSACTGSSGNCRKTCASDELDCYLLDNNGFIILSESSEHTGKFFGHIDGTIMDSLVQDRIFAAWHSWTIKARAQTGRTPTVPPARSLGPTYISHGYSSTLSPSPRHGCPCCHTLFEHGRTISTTTQKKAMSRKISMISTILMTTTTRSLSSPTIPLTPRPPWPLVHVLLKRSCITSNFVILFQEKPTIIPKPPVQAPTAKVVPDASFTRPCDLKTDLYILQPERLNSSTPLKGKLTNCHSSGCERPFSVQKIPHSNLILLVVDTLCPCGSKQLDISAQEVPGGSGKWTAS